MMVFRGSRGVFSLVSGRGGGYRLAGPLVELARTDRLAMNNPREVTAFVPNFSMRGGEILLAAWLLLRSISLGHCRSRVLDGYVGASTGGVAVSSFSRLPLQLLLNPRCVCAWRSHAGKKGALFAPCFSLFAFRCLFFVVFVFLLVFFFFSSFLRAIQAVRIKQVVRPFLIRSPGGISIVSPKVDDPCLFSFILSSLPLSFRRLRKPFEAVIHTQESTHKVRKFASRMALRRMQLTLYATHRTPHGALCAWSTRFLSDR